VIIGGIQSAFGDWPGYLQAGADAGTARLLHPAPGMQPFLYLPAFAWLFVPALALPQALSYAIDALVMAACAALAAVICAHLYGIRRGPAMLMTFAWNPVIYSIAIGQTSNLGLLLATLCTLGLARGSLWLTAFPAALLLYKPTYAVPLFAIMVIRRRFAACAVAIAGGALLYIPSAWAANDDAAWPRQWLAALRTWFPNDNWHSSAKAISTTTLLVHAHVPALIIGALVAFVVAASVPLLLRIPIEEAAACAMALGIVVSAHALTYEAVMLLPLLFVAITRLREPWRTRCAAGVYVLAAFAPYADVIGFNSLALIVPTIGLGWIAIGYATSSVSENRDGA